MKIVRTPDHRFENLPGYEFSANYLEVEEGLRMHYVDEGDHAKPTVLLLHGEPSWSYLYRKMIPILSVSAFRVIAPDLIGFGKSDKPVDQSSYSYQKHIDWLSTFIQKLDLRDIVLFCQDWGGLTGLRIITLMEDRFSMVVASNTILPVGQGSIPDSFLIWREFSQSSPEFDSGRVIDTGTLSPLSDEIIAAYNAPFPSEDYKAGARIFPTLVPIDFDDPESVKNRKAWEVLAQWKKPFLTIFGDKDIMTKGAEKVLQSIIPGAQNQSHVMLNAGHFIQEDKGEELAKLVMEFYNGRLT